MYAHFQPQVIYNITKPTVPPIPPHTHTSFTFYHLSLSRLITPPPNPSHVTYTSTCPQDAE